MSRPKSTRLTADQVADVRSALNETQDEFAQRFARSRFAIIRWERNGVKFKYRSRRWHAWTAAIAQVKAIAHEF